MLKNSGDPNKAEAQGIKQKEHKHLEQTVINRDSVDLLTILWALVQNEENTDCGFKNTHEVTSSAGELFGKGSNLIFFFYCTAPTYWPVISFVKSCTAVQTTKACSLGGTVSMCQNPNKSLF